MLENHSKYNFSHFTSMENKILEIIYFDYQHTKYALAMLLTPFYAINYSL